MPCRLFFVFFFLFLFICSASFFLVFAVPPLCEGCFYMKSVICSSLSGSWAVSRAWRPYRMRVEAAESERHCENRESVSAWRLQKKTDGSWQTLRTLERKRVYAVRKKNRRSSLALSKYVKLNEDAYSNTPSCSPWRVTVMSLKCVCPFTVIMAFSPSITVEMYVFSIKHFPWIWYKIRTETLKNVFSLSTNC